MAGIGNAILFSQGMRLTPSTSADILQMQKVSTDIANINYTGDPETNVSANPGSICHDPVSGNVYIKDSGTGNTGWIQVPLPTSGTFTPVVTGSISDPTITYNSQVGRYYRIGNLVQFNLTIGFTAVSGGDGGLIVGNLPFLSENIATQWTNNVGSLVNFVDNQYNQLTTFLDSNSNLLLCVFNGSPYLITDLPAIIAFSPQAYIFASGIYRI